jgi:hypothetical protein
LNGLIRSFTAGIQTSVSLQVSELKMAIDGIANDVRTSRAMTVEEMRVLRASTGAYMWSYQLECPVCCCAIPVSDSCCVVCSSLDHTPAVCFLERNGSLSRTQRLGDVVLMSL